MLNFFRKSRPADSPELKAQVAALDDTLRERIIQVLRAIYDPEIPVNIYDLGLIYDITKEAPDQVLIRMTLTAPACPVAGTMPRAVEKAVASLDEVASCRVELVWDPPWNKELISDEAKLQLGIL